MREVLSGAIAAGALVTALYFLRFWRRSNDRLFVFFSLAFGLMGVNHVGLGVLEVDDESRIVLYGVRLVAFLLILIAILDKNRARR